MFAGLWPGFDESEVPIGSVTNGVHAPSWVAGEIIALAEGEPDCPSAAGDWPAWDRVAAAGPERIWRTRAELRARLVDADPAAAAGLVAPARCLGCGADLDR